MGNTDAKFDTIFGKDFPIILAANRHLASIKAITLRYDAAGYEVGRVVSRRTSNGIYEKYANGGGDGTGTAVGVLFEPVSAVDFATTGSTVSARVVVGGELYDSQLVGIDSTARTQLLSRVITNAAGVAIFKF